MIKKLLYTTAMGCVSLNTAKAVAASCTDIDLKTFDLSANKKGFQIDGANKFDDFDNLGWSVRNLGDINGDGIDDLIAGAPFADPSADPARKDAGIAYVVFGKKKGEKFYDIDLKNTDLAATGQGFRILGARGPGAPGQGGDNLGWSVNNAGDFNGDGINDIIIGAVLGDRGDATDAIDQGVGLVYVIFGQCKNSKKFYDIDLRDTNLAAKQQGFRVLGGRGPSIVSVDSGDNLGIGVSPAGDVNGDKCSDIIMGAYGFDPDADRLDAGAAYVLFGNCKKGAKFYDVDLRTTDLAEKKIGFRVDGSDVNEHLGFAVSEAGDVNNDGCDDIVLGTLSESVVPIPGTAYVIYGKCKKGSKFYNIDLKTTDLADTKQGFKIIGENPGDFLGGSVSTAGDVNGDGIDDLLIGASSADPYGRVDAGIAYVIFGKCKKFDDIDLSKVNLAKTKQGFRILGSQGSTDENNYSEGVGNSVSAAGDLNGDKCSDIIIGAPGFDPSTDRVDAGAAYVVFGKCKKGEKFYDIDLKKVDLAKTKQGFAVFGARGRITPEDENPDELGFAVSGAGDINDDGRNDILISAAFADPFGRVDAGTVYVIFS